MDGFSSQTATDPFEDRIRQMLNSDKPSANVRLPPSNPNVRLPPATNFPQQQQPAGAPSYATRYGGRNPASPQGYGPSSPGARPPPPPPSQFVPPHRQHQGGQRNSVNHPPPGPRYQTNPHPHHPSQINGPQQGHHPLPHHPRGPHPPASGQYRGPHQYQQRGPQPQQGNYQPLDPDAFNRGGAVRNQVRPALFDPNARSRQPGPSWNDARQRQAQYLEEVVAIKVSSIDMTQAEREEKDAFRQTLDKLCHQVCEKNPNLPKVNLECFGSFASGFASAGSDMDLVIVVQNSEPTSAIFSLLEKDLPRTLEDALLRAGHGARLLTRTRVPIIKVCQSPNSSLLDRLRAERERWDFLPNEKKYPHLFENEENDADDDTPQVKDQAVVDHATVVTADSTTTTPATATSTVQKTGSESKQPPDLNAPLGSSIETTASNETSAQQNHQTQRHTQGRTWTRERVAGPLDFPKDGVGIQCDINFFNPLGLHNTHMLRCYSLCDPRVRPMVLFVKEWAKLRRINSSYSGTLSSYGFVMMVLHYLMNVAQPAVIPNLQLPWRPNAQCTPQGASKTKIDEWDVDFWRNEDEIIAALHKGQMSTNKESIGSLLAGFFQYYSSMGQVQFRWTQQVLSLRTPGGILTKDQKGWVKATTEEGEGKKIQHRYLFAIEDPFELNHNVARTVTHNGIVAIRDEFRRAQRILYAIGNGMRPHEGDLLAKLIEADDFVKATAQLKLASNDFADGQVTQHGPEQKQQRGPKKPSIPQPNGQKKNMKKQLDLADQDAFPALGAASARKQGSIDGEQAQAHLAEYRRKKAEAQGEETANSAVDFLGL